MTDVGHGSPPYMLHRKALFRLTELLRDRIRLSDESIARLRAGGTVVDGLKPGVTEIQVAAGCLAFYLQLTCLHALNCSLFK